MGRAESRSIKRRKTRKRCIGSNSLALQLKSSVPSKRKLFKRRITPVIDELIENPRPKGVLKLREHKNLYRIRVGLYRVVYEIDDEIRLIRVTGIRHRREIYR